MCNSRRKENPNALQSNEVLYFDVFNTSIIYVRRFGNPIKNYGADNAVKSTSTSKVLAC